MTTTNTHSACRQMQTGDLPGQTTQSSWLTLSQGVVPSVWCRLSPSHRKRWACGSISCIARIVDAAIDIFSHLVFSSLSTSTTSASRTNHVRRFTISDPSIHMYCQIHPPRSVPISATLVYQICHAGTSILVSRWSLAVSWFTRGRDPTFIAMPSIIQS